jgi:hypothetical protein
VLEQTGKRILADDKICISLCTPKVVFASNVEFCRSDVSVICFSLPSTYAKIRGLRHVLPLLFNPQWTSFCHLAKKKTFSQFLQTVSPENTTTLSLEVHWQKQKWIFYFNP